MKKWIVYTMMILIGFLLAACELSLNSVPDDIDEDENIVIPDEEEAIDYNVESFDRFFDDTKTKTLHIEITQEKWDELDQEMQTYYQMFGHYRTDYMVEANLNYEDDEGTLLVEQIGFRTRGNLSRGPIQDQEGNPLLQNFKISFHEPYHQDYDKRTVFELEEIDLKWNRNWDATYLTEKFSLDTFSALGVYAAHTTLVQFKITVGEQTYDYGIYTAFEPIDDNFIKRRFDKESNDGVLYKSLWQNYGPANLGYPIANYAIGIKDEALNYRPSYDLKTQKEGATHQELTQFIKDINEKSVSDFELYIQENFEVDMFLKYLAVGVLLGNPDDYRAMGNNYYIYQNSATKKWVIIPYDYDHGMGQGWDGAPIFSDWSIGMDIYTWGNLNAHMLNQENYPHVLVDKILAISSYQSTYELYLIQLINGSDAIFSTTRFMNLYHQQSLLYSQFIPGSLMNMPFGLRNIIDYMNRKIENIQNQLIYYQMHPEERGA